MKKVILSYSKCAKYWKCPFRLKCDIEHREKEDGNFTFTIPGSIMHKLAEEAFLTGSPSEKKLWSYKNIIPIQKVVLKKTPLILSKNKSLSFASTEEEMKKYILSLRNDFYSLLEEKGYFEKEVVGVEYKLGMIEQEVYDAKKQCEPYILEGEYPVRLSVDLITREELGIVINDYKMSRSLYALDPKQLYLYALAYEQETGETVYGCRFILPILKKEVFYPFNEASRVAVRTWLSAVNNGIKEGKFNKSPEERKCLIYCPYNATVCKFSAKDFKKPTKKAKEGKISFGNLL